MGRAVDELQRQSLSPGCKVPSCPVEIVGCLVHGDAAKHHGLPLPPGETVSTPTQARTVAERLGVPVVVKAQGLRLTRVAEPVAAAVAVLMLTPLRLL